jgi:hypothetical protein
MEYGVVAALYETSLIDYLEGGDSLAASLESRAPAQDTQAQPNS